MAASESTASVVGDFVLVWGPSAAAYLAKLDGFTRITDDGEPAQAAVRGAVRHGKNADGSRFVAVADLIEGDVADGTRALGNGAPPHHGWRGRFAQVVWQP